MLLTKDPEWARYHISLPDGGPFYTETNLEHFIVEPWNALSSLCFLIPAFYWLIKIAPRFKEFAFLTYCIPLLILGGLGSTFFHAFRSSELLLWMDVLPILVLTLSVSTYFWHKVYNNWTITIVTMIISFLCRRLILTFDFMASHTAINISYAIGGITIFLPVVFVLVKSQFRKINIVLLSIFFFALSLVCREIDARNIHAFSMGTHFLWHIFSAVGAFFLASYLYFIKDFENPEGVTSSKKSISITSDEKSLTT